VGRPAKIAGTAIQGKVDWLLDQRVPAPDIARQLADAGHSVSVPTIYNYARSRRAVIARLFEQEVTPLDLVHRLIALADAARAARQAAAATGNATAIARAISVETGILSKLSAFDIDLTSFREMYAEVSGFAVGLRHLVEKRPEVARILAENLIEKPETRDLGRSILDALIPSGDTA
jgi:AcrR family transcriptional regulator